MPLSSKTIQLYRYCRVGFVDLFWYFEKPHNIATKARWDGIGWVDLSAGSAGSNVVTVAAGSLAKLASVSAGDPVRLILPPPAWLLAISPNVTQLMFNVTVQAVGESTLTLTHALPSTIVTNATMSYQHTDFAHPYWMASAALHQYLWNPARKKYEFYLGKLLTTVLQTTAGRVESGGASVAAASWEADAWPPKPGINRTADVIHNVSLGTNGDAVKFPGTSCIISLSHVARFYAVSLAASGPDSLRCWVEDAAGAVKSDVITPEMYGGIDMVNIPFTPTATGDHFVKIQQNGAADASCYISEIEYRRIPSDGADSLMPSTGSVLIQGDSNMYNAAAWYTAGDSKDLTGGRARANGVSGRELARQARELTAYLDRNYTMAISNETANAAAAQHAGTNIDLSPLYGTEAYTAEKYGKIAAYWVRLVAEQVPIGMALFMGELRIGEHATAAWEYTPIAADMARQARIDLSV
jgi:hypothetical protein